MPFSAPGRERNIPNSAVFGKPRNVNNTEEDGFYTRKGCVKFGGGPKKTFFPGRKKLHGWKGPTLLLILKRSTQKEFHGKEQNVARNSPPRFYFLLSPQKLANFASRRPIFSLSLFPPMASNNGACATMGEGGMWWALTQNRATTASGEGEDIFSPAGCPCCSTSLLPYFNDQ